MKIRHIDLPEALSQLPEERIEEALTLDSADALSEAKSREKALCARANGERLKRWLPVPLCAALCLAVVLPLTFSLPGKNREGFPDDGNKQGDLIQIANPWICVETEKDVCDALCIQLPDLPHSKTVKSCAVLSNDSSNLSDAEMGDILFTDGSRLSLRVIDSDLLDESEMDRLGGVYGAALTAKEQRGNVTVYHFKTPDSGFTAWVNDGVYYWYESVSPNDLEQMISLLLPCS